MEEDKTKITESFEKSIHLLNIMGICCKNRDGIFFVARYEMFILIDLETKQMYLIIRKKGQI